jgi:hypothetical protein
MHRTQTASRRIGRNAQMAQLAFPRASAAAFVAVVPILIPARPVDLCEEPKRGVPLKNVASFMMAMALMCLLALIAGRVDAARTDAGLAYGSGGESRAMVAAGDGCSATTASEAATMEAASASMDADAN